MSYAFRVEWPREAKLVRAGFAQLMCNGYNRYSTSSAYQH
jgi:hypothetical protein